MEEKAACELWFVWLRLGEGDEFERVRKDGDSWETALGIAKKLYELVEGGGYENYAVEVRSVRGEVYWSREKKTVEDEDEDYRNYDNGDCGGCRSS